VILVDSSVWVNHLHGYDAVLRALLDAGRVLIHPFVIGELAVGNIRKREAVLRELQELPHATVASDSEVLRLIEHHQLFGRGLGYIDAHLLASIRFVPGGSLWTRDRRLQTVAEQLSLSSKTLN
jgi:predicted nucleic acid-binding protein